MKIKDERNNDKNNPEKEEKTQDANNQENEKDFWDDAKQNIIEGAKVVSEESKNIEKTVGSKASELYQTVKEKTGEVIQSGLEFTRETYDKAVTIVEKYQDKQDIKKLLDKKNELARDFGLFVYLTYINENRLPENFFSQKDVKTSIKKIANIEREIIKKAEELGNK